MSSRRTPKLRPEMHAMTSNSGEPDGALCWLNSARCCMRVTLSRAVPPTGMNSETPTVAYLEKEQFFAFIALLHLRVAF